MPSFRASDLRARGIVLDSLDPASITDYIRAFVIIYLTLFLIKNSKQKHNINETSGSGVFLKYGFTLIFKANKS
jgi:hypothetical protein